MATDFNLNGRMIDKVSNEFAVVHFAKVDVGNGERLLLENPGTNESVLLDPVVLEAIIDIGVEGLTSIVVTSRE